MWQNNSFKFWIKERKKVIYSVINSVINFLCTFWFEYKNRIFDLTKVGHFILRMFFFSLFKNHSYQSIIQSKKVNWYEPLNKFWIADRITSSGKFFIRCLTKFVFICYIFFKSKMYLKIDLNKNSSYLYSCYCLTIKLKILDIPLS